VKQIKHTQSSYKYNSPQCTVHALQADDYDDDDDDDDYDDDE